MLTRVVEANPKQTYQEFLTTLRLVYEYIVRQCTDAFVVF